eukprot:scaffold126584_cov37-Tisochrysis_lutea.AAC.1
MVSGERHKSAEAEAGSAATYSAPVLFSGTTRSQRPNIPLLYPEISICNTSAQISRWISGISWPTPTWRAERHHSCCIPPKNSFAGEGCYRYWWRSRPRQLPPPTMSA